MLDQHGLGRFAKRGPHTLCGQIVPNGFRQESSECPPLITCVGAELLQRLPIHLGAEFDHFAHQIRVLGLRLDMSRYIKNKYRLAVPFYTGEAQYLHAEDAWAWAEKADRVRSGRRRWRPSLVPIATPISRTGQASDVIRGNSAGERPIGSTCLLRDLTQCPF